MNAGMADGHIHTFEVKEESVATLAGHPRITVHVADANSEAGLLAPARYALRQILQQTAPPRIASGRFPSSHRSRIPSASCVSPAMKSLSNVRESNDQTTYTVSRTPPREHKKSRRNADSDDLRYNVSDRTLTKAHVDRMLRAFCIEQIDEHPREERPSCALPHVPLLKRLIKLLERSFEKHQRGLAVIHVAGAEHRPRASATCW